MAVAVAMAQNPLALSLASLSGSYACGRRHRFPASHEERPGWPLGRGTVQVDDPHEPRSRTEHCHHRCGRQPCVQGSVGGAGRRAGPTVCRPQHSSLTFTTVLYVIVVSRHDSRQRKAQIKLLGTPSVLAIEANSLLSTRAPGIKKNEAKCIHSSYDREKRASFEQQAAGL